MATEGNGSELTELTTAVSPSAQQIPVTPSDEALQIACICGTLMVQGRVQTGLPKCANINCPSAATTTDGSCYYCANSSAMHPQGFFYCNTCASAVAKAGVIQQQTVVAETQYTLPPKEEFVTTEIGFGTALKWLIYKNFKQQCLRRPCALVCKLLCPALCIMILGFIRIAVKADAGYTDYYEVYEGSFVTEDTIQSSHWITDSVCAYEYDWVNYTYTVTSLYLAIIPPPESNEHIRGLLEVMGQSWKANGTDQEVSDLINTNPYGDYDWDCNSWAQYLPFREGWLLRYFDSDDEFNKFITADSYGREHYQIHPSATVDPKKPIGTAISFEVNEDGTQWSYKLRGNGSQLLYVPDTDGDKVDKFTRTGAEDLMWEGPDQYMNGFVHMQAFIDNSITKYMASLHGVSASEISEIDAMYKGIGVMPVEVPEQDAFWTYIGFAYVFFSMCQFVYPFSQVVSQIIHEKADKIKEGMKMMGVTVSTYWCSWYIWLWMEATVIALLCFAVGTAFSIYKWSDPVIILIWLELFCLNFVCLGTLFSTFFDNPKIATLSAFVVFMVLMLGDLYSRGLDEAGKNALCLLGPCCFSMSTSTLGQYESSLMGIQWDNISDVYGDFKFSTAMLMLFFDSIIYIILTLYFNMVWPSRYGQHMHPLFFASTSFWCPNKDKGKNNTLSQQLIRQKSDTKYETLSADKYDDSNILIKIRGLKKHFKSLFDFSQSGQIVKAVDGISLDMYMGEVFCLLGHNGAGKTTTIGMLTGLLQVTEGDAFIDGHSVVGNMKAIRRNLGVCPQHDVLFRRLTCQEHLQLYARLKGVPEGNIGNEVERTLISVGIKEKESSFPHQMSGGQKRKLSLGIALIGGSKIVFLDEPTSGMDPQSRRVTWNMIAKEKRERCIILTTHFMDEADILGDRIAIMTDGSVNCCGSSLFLKRQYGVGYTFVVSLNIGVADSLAVKQRIDEIILGNVSGSECIANAGAEITYRLPFDQTQAFPQIFEVLESKKAEFGIKTYGISITTLEEVFLKIGAMEAEAAKLRKGKTANVNNDIDTEEKYVDIPEEDPIKNPFPQPTFQLEEQSEFVIFFRHIFAVLYQRFLLSYRDYRSLCCQILLPALFAAGGLGLLKAATDPPDNNALLMTVDQWYSPSEYNLPISNAVNSGAGVNNEFLVDFENNYLHTFDTEMEAFAGNAQLFDYSSVTTQESYEVYNHSTGQVQYVSGTVTDLEKSGNNFLNVLLAERTPSDGILHYNAFYIPEMVHTPTIFSVINASAKHSLPITFNALNNWILKHKLRDVLPSEVTPEIKCYSWPLPVTTSEKQFTGMWAGLFVSIFLMIALSFLPMGAIYTIVNDKSNLTKHQQLVSGVSCASYWCANYIADFLISIPTLLVIWALVHIFDADTYLGDQQAPFILTLVLFSLSVLPFTYLLSFLFRSASKAQLIVGASYVVLSVLLLITSFITDQLPDSTLSKSDKQTLADTYRVFPTFLMAHSLFVLALRAFARIDDPYQWDIIGQDLTYMAIQCVGYFLAVILIEYALLYKTVISKRWNRDNDEVNALVSGMDYSTADSDVQNEIERIKGYSVSDASEDKVVISGLHKIYKSNLCSRAGAQSVHAVRGVHLGVKRGEVFGYLGVNGAGKTTTLACLTGERSATFGDAYINGISIAKQTAVRRFVGYCPQFDALFPLLTGKEHLRFYARIKGLKGAELAKQVRMLLRVLSLTKYENRRAGTYSGGNKRKLSVAISMIGNPPIVFLDEPSTGMDPMARRSMWEFIRETMHGRCVILTTHSMEECEALCHRLCIMTEGQLRCLGTPQHLKSKFGKGYQLDLTIFDSDSDSGNELTIENHKTTVESELMKLFEIQLIEHAQTKLVYQLNVKNGNGNGNGNGMSLGQIFQTLEELKQKLPIQSYALNQTTLEQIFIKMAKQSF